MKSVYDCILDSFYRISHTVPLCLEASDKFPWNKDFWEQAAKDEMGHDKVLLDELIQFLGPTVIDDLMEYRPPARLVKLLNWVNECERNALVYKAFFETTLFSPEFRTTREFYYKIAPKFMKIHEEEDPHHSAGVLERLKGLDISSQVHYIMEHIV